MSMILKDTNAGQIASAILKARRNLGSSGMAFTLVVVTDSRHYSKVFDAAMEAGREHPSRILVVVQGRAQKTALEAEIHTDGGVPGDVVTLRMTGELEQHADSVVLPLLLPDSPVVVWWPNESPLDPGKDAIGVLATRRITDAAGVADPVNALLVRAEHHSPGDTDLTWTRLTPWRAMLAAALDQYHVRITGVTIEAAAGNAPAQLMAAWLHDRLNVDVEVARVPGPGIGAVRLHSLAGDVVLAREPESGMASYLIPGQPPRMVALPRRDINQLITEELRRMDPDDIFEQATQTMLRRDREGLVAHTRRRSTPDDGEASPGSTKVKKSSGRIIAAPSQADVVPADGGIHLTTAEAKAQKKTDKASGKRAAKASGKPAGKAKSKGKKADTTPATTPDTASSPTQEPPSSSGSGTPTDAAATPPDASSQG